MQRYLRGNLEHITTPTPLGKEKNTPEKPRVSALRNLRAGYALKLSRIDKQCNDKTEDNDGFRNDRKDKTLTE